MEWCTHSLSHCKYSSGNYYGFLEKKHCYIFGLWECRHTSINNPCGRSDRNENILRTHFPETPTMERVRSRHFFAMCGQKMMHMSWMFQKNLNFRYFISVCNKMYRFIWTVLTVLLWGGRALGAHTRECSETLEHFQRKSFPWGWLNFIAYDSNLFHEECI